MIEDVKGVPSVPQKDRTTTLATNFKNLSSGARISKANASKAQPKNDPAAVSSVAADLNDAVSYSSLALKSLEKVGQATANGNGSGNGNDGKLVQEFIPDLEKLRDNIGETLSSLRKHAEQVDIAKENMASAGARIEDVDVAQARAEQTGMQIHTQIDQALGAHTELNSDRVARLLTD